MSVNCLFLNGKHSTTSLILSIRYCQLEAHHTWFLADIDDYIEDMQEFTLAPE